MSIKSHLVFDIETRPLPVEYLESNGLLPEITAPGNYKDPDKIAAYIAEKKVEAVKDGALSALTGEVCAIAYSRNDTDVVITATDGVTEAQLLAAFWAQAVLTIRSTSKLVGFNIKSFDLPFLLRRSWVHKVAHPAIWVDRYFLGTHVWDLRETWQLGDRQAPGSLDRICRALGLGQKTGNGADFGALLASDPAKAREYCLNDLQMTKALAARLATV